LSLIGFRGVCRIVVEQPSHTCE